MPAILCQRLALGQLLEVGVWLICDCGEDAQSGKRMVGNDDGSVAAHDLFDEAAFRRDGDDGQVIDSTDPIDPLQV